MNVNQTLKLKLPALLTAVSFFCSSAEAAALSPSSRMADDRLRQSFKEEADRRAAGLAPLLPEEAPKPGIRGALVFDVDGTLLESRKTLGESETGKSFASALKHGYRVALISANSSTELRRRIVEPLKRLLGEKRACLVQLVIYANGGATKIQFDPDGNEQTDEAYSRRSRISQKEIEAMKSVLKEAAKEKFGLTSGEQAAWAAWFKDRPDFPGVRFILPWMEGREFEPLVLPPEGVRGIVSSPWIEVRDGVQASLKLLPKAPVDVRPDLIKRLRKAFGSKSEIFVAPQAAGFASIDILFGGVDKRVALEDLIQSGGFDPGSTVYLGDELVEGGNDFPVLSVPGVVKLAVSKTAGGAAAGALWLGRDPRAVQEYLAALIREPAAVAPALKGSANYRSLLAVFGQDEAGLDQAIWAAARRLGAAPAQIISGDIGDQVSVPVAAALPERETLPRPQVVKIGGGSAMDVLGEKLPGSVVAVVTSLDDGGSSLKLQKDVEPVVGYVPSAGDNAKALFAFAGPDKQRAMEYRFGHDAGTAWKSFEEEMARILRETQDFVKNGQADLPVQERIGLSADWLVFCANMLSLARIIDEHFIKPGIFDLRGHSVKNLVLFAAEFAAGGYRKTRGIDEERFRRGLLLLAKMAGIERGMALPATLEKGRLFARLESGREVFKQTEITERTHDSRIVDFGVVDEGGRRIALRAYPDAVRAIREAEGMIVVGPGSPYTSVMAVLLLPEIVEALAARSDIARIFVFNVCRRNEDEYDTIARTVESIERVAGRKFNELFSHVILQKADPVTIDQWAAEHRIPCPYEGGPKRYAYFFAHHPEIVRLLDMSVTQELIDAFLSENGLNEFGEPADSSDRFYVPEDRAQYVLKINPRDRETGSRLTDFLGREMARMLAVSSEAGMAGLKSDLDFSRYGKLNRGLLTPTREEISFLEAKGVEVLAVSLAQIAQEKTREVGAAGVKDSISSNPKLLGRAIERILEERTFREEALAADLAVLGFPISPGRPQKKKRNLEEVLLGPFRKAIEERYLGGKDLIADQRIADSGRARTLARNALAAMAAELARHVTAAGLKDLKEVTLGQFNRLLGVRQIVVASGLSTRFPGGVHKGLAGLREAGETFIRLSVYGARVSLYVAPVVVVGDAVLKRLLKEPERKIPYGAVPVEAIDPAKKRELLPADAVVVYAPPTGHGDAFLAGVEGLSRLGIDRETAYYQMIPGDVPSSALREKSNSSLITWLTAVAGGFTATLSVRDSDKLGESARSPLQGKGVLLYDSAGRPKGIRDQKVQTPEESERAQQALASSLSGRLSINATGLVFKREISGLVDIFRADPRFLIPDQSKGVNERLAHDLARLVYEKLPVGSGVGAASSGSQAPASTGDQETLDRFVASWKKQTGERPIWLNENAYDLAEETRRALQPLYPGVKLDVSIELLPLALLVPTQGKVRLEDVARRMAGRGTAADRPAQIWKTVRGEYFIWDGHHKAAAAREAGASEILAVVTQPDRPTDLDEILRRDVAEMGLTGVQDLKIEPAVPAAQPPDLADLGSQS